MSSNVIVASGPRYTSGDEMTRRQQMRAALAATIGTTVEWYDWALYTFAAGTFIGPLFYPSRDPFLSALAAFGSFFVGFAVRPIGAVVFGHYGDRLGRKATLIVTLGLMGAATFLMGLVPTYAQVGVWGGVLIFVLRLVQGLSAGGEWGGSVLLIVEWGQRGRRGLLGSLPQIGVPASVVLGFGGIQLSTALFGAGSYWGWRVPFLLSVVMVAIGLFIRLSVLETPVFSKLREEQRVERAPVRTVLRTSLSDVVLTWLLRTSQTVPSFIALTFVLTYVPLELRMKAGGVALATVFAGLVSLFTIPFFGFLSDLVGRRRLYRLGTLVMLAWSFPFWALLDTKLQALMALAVVLTLPIHDIQYAPQATLIAETFTGRLRYSGASLGYQLASIQGGLAPLIALALLRAYHSSLPIAAFMAVCSAIGFVAVSLLRDRSRQDMSIEYEEQPLPAPPVRA